LLKRVRYCWSISHVRVHLCIGQDRSPVSSGHRKEVQSLTSPTSESTMIMLCNTQRFVFRHQCTSKLVLGHNCIMIRNFEVADWFRKILISFPNNQASDLVKHLMLHLAYFSSDAPDTTPANLELMTACRKLQMVDLTFRSQFRLKEGVQHAMAVSMSPASCMSRMLK
jgi:hypothetical protein